MDYKQIVTILTVLVTIYMNSAFILVHDAPRKVVKVLTVNNGGKWGDWHGPHFCADGTYAVGYNMKVQYNYSHVTNCTRV